MRQTSCATHDGVGERDRPLLPRGELLSGANGRRAGHTGRCAGRLAIRVAGTLASFRTPDGGYGKTPGAPFGSTYTSFLVALCLELLDRPIPAPDQLTEFVRSRRRPDGGYVEISAMKRSGTDPTAAGIGLLQILTRSTTHRVWGPPSSLPHFHRSSRAACAPMIAFRPPTCFRRSRAAGRSTNSARPRDLTGSQCEDTSGNASGRSEASGVGSGTSRPSGVHLLRSGHTRPGRHPTGMTEPCR